MAFLFLIPPLLGAAAATLLWLAGRWEIPGLSQFPAEWSAICALAVAIAASVVVSARAASTVSRRFMEVAAENAQFERLFANRLAQLEAKVAKLEAAEPQERPESVKPAPARFADALRATPVAESPPAPVAPPEQSENNVVKLDPRLRAGPERRVSRPLKEIEDAVAGGRYEAWYQPVVSLPERKVHYLTGYPYLFAGGSAPLAAQAWLDTAAACSRRGEIDKYMLMQGIRLRRDLARQEKSCGVIWSIGRPTLSDRVAWSEIAQVLKANRALGSDVICEIQLADYTELRPEELDALFMVREAGFQLGLRDCTSPRALSNAVKSGIFRFVSAEASFIAGALEKAELRSGDITYIATGVETEEDAIGLIDRDIKLAQGPLFAPAKPLRRGSETARAPDGAA